MVGDTYTILLKGEDTAGLYCLIDMHIPHGGGPPPHRHDFEEMFTVLEGEIEVTFRDEKSTVRAGDTVNIPANAPHSFANTSERPARLLCVCSPAGQEEFFLAVGVPVDGRTAAPPELDEAAQAAFVAKSQELAPDTGRSFWGLRECAAASTRVATSLETGGALHYARRRQYESLAAAHETRVLAAHGNRHRSIIHRTS